MTTLREAAQQALDAMELIVEADTPGKPKMVALARAMYAPTITALKAALAEHDKKIVWVEERKAHWAEQLQLARENQERERQQREEAALAEPVQEPVATVTECEACFTPDVCQLRGTCDHYAASQLRIAAPPQRPAEPVQEPVAWRWGYRSITTGEMDWRGYVEVAAHPNLRSPEIIMLPLYTAPPQRKPLTDEEISKILDDVLEGGSLEDVAREIERAHGIT